MQRDIAIPTAFEVQVGWGDVSAALDILARKGRGAFHPKPIGNRVVIKCSERSDAELLINTFVHARLLAG